MSTVVTQTQHDPETAFPTGLQYTAYAAFEAGGVRRIDRASRPDAARAALDALVVGGAALRGTYDVSGYRADADLLLWIAAPGVDPLQEALAGFRRTSLGRELKPFWSAIGVHRDAEFNKSHVPAFFAGEPARRYVCAYPFVRTTDWYLLAPDERRAMLHEHGAMARDFPDVRANTTSAFGLGDYEWLLAFEADELVRIVDLIRHLRAAKARHYTKNELPFITGVRRPLAAILDALP
jgi:hydrogen peroxide-dependent heme synthase